MYNISFDENENIVLIKIEGMFDLEQAEKAHNEITLILQKVKNGFIVLTDMSLLKEMNPESFKSISKTMDLFHSRGISHAIRVMPDPSKDIGFNIMDMFHYSPNVKIRTFESLENAKEYINTRKPQNA
jgi:hypothetical protein